MILIMSVKALLAQINLKSISIIFKFLHFDLLEAMQGTTGFFFSTWNGNLHANCCTLFSTECLLVGQIY